MGSSQSLDLPIGAGKDDVTQIHNYRHLSPTLATSGQPLEAELRLIADAGYEVIVNLALHGTKSALADERASTTSLGLVYEHIPVVWENPTRENLKEFFEVMDRHAGRRVWLHCVANFRASAFAMLYRVKRLGWAAEDALPDLQALWEPYGAWPAFIDSMLKETEF